MCKIGFDDDAVDNDIDTVFSFAIQFRRGIQFTYHAINPGTDKALTQQAFQKLLIFSFAILDHRRQEQDSGPFLKRQHTIHHFTHCARGQDNAMIRAPGLSDPSVEQP